MISELLYRLFYHQRCNFLRLLGFKKQQVLLCSEPVTSDKDAIWKLDKSLALNSGSLQNFFNNLSLQASFLQIFNP